MTNLQPAPFIGPTQGLLRSFSMAYHSKVMDSSEAGVLFFGGFLE